MKSLINKMIIVSFVLSLTVAVQAAITNTYEVNTDSAQISIQPTPYDLLQASGTTNFIVKGALHGVVPDGTLALYDSRSVGDFGDPAHGFNGGCVLFQDGISPDNDVAINVVFDAPKKIQEVRVFSNWGDQRQFAYFEVWTSTTGTNDVDYSFLGVTKNGEFGETNDPPNVAYYRVARLYDPDDGVLANNITSIKLVQRNVGYGIEAGKGVLEPPATPQGSYVSIASSSEKEIDIIGTDVNAVNEFYSELNLASLPLQPQSDDLAQGSGATNYIVAGGMHNWAGFVSNFFRFMFNSPVDGDLGVGDPLTVGGTEVVLFDATPPETLSLEMNCDFDSPKTIDAIQVFSLAGDSRIFNYGEVYSSTTGTDLDDYTYLGAVSFGNWGDDASLYANSNCVARLYDSVDGTLATDVRSVKIRFLGVMDTVAWSSAKTFGSSGGSAIGEIDIIGIPEPATLLIGGLFIGLAFLRRR